MTGQLLLPGINPPEFPACQRTCAAFVDDHIGFTDWATGKRAGPRCAMTIDWWSETADDNTVHIYCRRFSQ